MSKTNDIRITISGRPGSGKSAIAQVMAKTLQDLGFAVVIPSDGDCRRHGSQLWTVIKTIRADAEVTIVEAGTAPRAVSDPTTDAALKELARMKAVCERLKSLNERDLETRLMVIDALVRELIHGKPDQKTAPNDDY